MSKTLADIKASLPPERQERIDARVRELLAQATKEAWRKAEVAMDDRQPRFGYRNGKPSGTDVSE